MDGAETTWRMEDGPDPDGVRDLEALAAFSFEGTPLAVLGSPVAHSVSPPMHNAALREMARSDSRFADWRYFKFDIPAEKLPEALPLLHAKGFLGVNLTIPHKVQAVDLVTQIDPGARRMGAVNTLLRQDGGYAGYNSDGFGLEAAVREELRTGLEGATVILLGAGGAARAIAVQCLERGCRALWVGNRNQQRLAGLLEILREASPESAGAVRGFDLTQPPADLPTDGLLINATALGLKPGDPAPIGLDRFSPSLKVYDTIYNPEETPLLAAARARGMAAANGLSMLVWQGVRSLEIWSGASVPDEAMMSAARSALGLK